MKSQINLASKKIRNKSLGKFNIAAIFVFAAVFLTAVAILGYLLFVHFQITNLDQTSNNLDNQIQELSSAKLNVLLLKERLGSISQVLANRTDVNSKMQTVLSLLPSNIEIGSVETDPNQVQVQLTSPSLNILNSVLETNISNFVKQPVLSIQKIDLQSFSADPKSGNYTAVLNFEFKPSGSQ